MACMTLQKQKHTIADEAFGLSNKEVKKGNQPT